MATPDLESTRQRLHRLAWLLDNSIRLPSLGYRIGLDAILGLVPGIGDVIGVVLSSYIVREAARVGLPKAVLARMVFNVAVEGIVGMVPLVGDLFDAGWKANQRNVRLLSEYIENPHRQTVASRTFILAITVLLVAILSATGWASFLLLRWVWQTLTG